MKCGFIGLGSQGAPMAQRIIESGFETILWARRHETLEPFRASGASFAESVEVLASEVDYCAICVVDDAGVQDVFGRVVSHMPTGGVIVIHSTINATLCVELAEEASKKGIALIDAPVSGGGSAAANGTLTVMLGGDAAVLGRVRPVIETFAGDIVHVGAVGTGQLAKLLNNSMMAANLAIADHGMACASDLNLDIKAFTDLVKISSGRSFAFDVRARMEQPTDFVHGARLLDKDIGLLSDALGPDHSRYKAVASTAEHFINLAVARDEQ